MSSLGYIFRFRSVVILVETPLFWLPLLDCASNDLVLFQLALPCLGARE